MSQEVIFFGHIVLDTIVKGDKRWQSLGGTVVYGALTSLRFEAKPVVVSKVGEDFPDEYLIFLSRNGIDLSFVRMVRGTKTTRFKLTYKNAERELTLQAKSEDITLFDVELVDLGGKVAIVGPVIAEVTLDALDSIRSRAALTALDLQGYLRSAKPREPVKLARSDSAIKALSKADVVHMDENEARVLTGLEPKEAAAWVASNGPKVALVTMGYSGAYIASGGETIFIPAFEPDQVLDTTGTGDIFLTVFTLEYSRGAPLKTAAAMAAAAASYRVERLGFDGLRDRWTVRNRAQKLLESLEYNSGTKTN
ncbi:MAG: PfkB family carbohydrate kinase [Thermofilaceae archaeon]|nr:PfkB family carbohydrate kinase [Thermofilaceae archaeon]MCX8180792.1 PfkB family carbohydrate kinase [Thermofilaceae archaeon]MDW8004812.1 PfkB family carbohydrate kinase [Thermofilaceae archaeon]